MDGVNVGWITGFAPSGVEMGVNASLLAFVAMDGGVVEVGKMIGSS